MCGWWWCKNNMPRPEDFGLDSYTGPFISDGEFQTSVEFGTTKPRNELDALSRLHDSAYAKWPDKLHRTVADAIYNEQAKKLVGKFPELARHLVLYGNAAMRAAANLYEGMKFGLLGLVAAGVINMYDLHNYMTNQNKIRVEILAYFATDPLKKTLAGVKALENVFEVTGTLDRMSSSNGFHEDLSGKITYNPSDDYRLSENQGPRSSGTPNIILGGRQDDPMVQIFDPRFNHYDKNKITSPRVVGTQPPTSKIDTSTTLDSKQINLTYFDNARNDTEHSGSRVNDVGYEKGGYDPPEVVTIYQRRRKRRGKKNSFYMPSY
jgi:hypothetical protein